MNAMWQVQTAKNRFSEVIDRAVNDGPQTITRHGRPVVRVVSVADGIDAAPAQKMDNSFAQFLLSAPRSDDFTLPVRRSRKSPVQLGG